MLGVVDPLKFPRFELPEIAFVGRSNVGKSSLVNSIVLRKNLARTSSVPGKTREINFYKVDDKWILVDMPGLGYTAVGVGFRERFAKLNHRYLTDRESLRLVCVLVDSRHEPMNTDLATIETLENCGRRFLIVLTKCDKLSASAIRHRKEQFEILVSKCEFNVDVLPYSSLSNLGRDQLVGIIKSSIV